ncbi:unnamed protein product [Bursaphelenchus xylophilus]|uniref:(pine wood nematode) hypothetical protein n=1 Tax=Bursaphelenchus xylophilus TaxID=6326 RepID=A0A1I7SPW8_BURXY|nr:unnamed protein product [Bursaphelenchus xylophilus]CAG9109308.1 unnamed protein product [Bursaphelenchus xylophilus]
MSKHDDQDPLLPTSAKLTIPPQKRHAAQNSQSTLNFKIYVITSMTFLWTGYTLLVRHTRSTTGKDEMYSAPTVVCLAELIKFFIAFILLSHDHKYNMGETIITIKRDFINKPMDLVKMSVPSITYALQNNLDFVALSNLSAGVYQVTTQLKVVTTALFMMAFLGRKFSRTRWVAIFMLFAGVAAVQLNNIDQNSSAGKPNENPVVGLVAVLATCVTAGFAGVYFEMMLKDGTPTSLWIRNMQMYFCGIISTGVGVLAKDSEHLQTKGFFHGYNAEVWAIVLSLSVGGIYISLVMKYLDNLHKSFASSISIILVVLLSVMLFDSVSLGLYFLFGSLVVCGAVVLYNSVPE